MAGASVDDGLRRGAAAGDAMRAWAVSGTTGGPGRAKPEHHGSARKPGPFAVPELDPGTAGGRAGRDSCFDDSRPGSRGGEALNGGRGRSDAAARRSRRPRKEEKHDCRDGLRWVQGRLRDVTTWSDSVRERPA